MKVSIFITCICDSLYPQIGEAMVRVLAARKVKLDFPLGQTCCGQPGFSSGYWKEAREVAKQTLETFRHSRYVVAPSGSCVAAIKEYYPLLFAKDTQYKRLADELIDKTYEFTEFLVEVLKVKDLGLKFPYRVTYHPSCHASRLVGVTASVLSILENTKGLEYIPLPRQDACCGFGGTFAVKMPEISAAMVDDKVTNILHTDADVLVGTDMGCLMNIDGRLKKQGAKIRVLHIAQLIDEGLRA